MTIHVALGARSYPIHIERGLLGRAADHLVPLARGRTMAIVTDENVRPLLDTLQTALTAAGVASAAIVLATGKATKSWDQLEGLTDRLLELGDDGYAQIRSAACRERGCKSWLNSWDDASLKKT